MVLRRMDQLKPIMSGAIKGTLTQSEFYQRNRDRKNVLVYRRNIEEYLTERGIAISKNILLNAASDIALADFVARLNCAAPPAKHNILSIPSLFISNFLAIFVSMLNSSAISPRQTLLGPLALGLLLSSL